MPGWCPSTHCPMQSRRWIAAPSWSCTVTTECAAPPQWPGCESAASFGRAISSEGSTGGVARSTRQRAATDHRRATGGLMLGPLLLAVGAGFAVLRLRAARRAERAYAHVRPPGVDGVVPGTEGFTLEGSTGRALLMLHGFGDTPQTLRYLGGRLHAAGFTVHAPLLPGHGRGLRDFSAASAEDYASAARDELVRLRARASWVGVIGLSMGGAIAARLAAETDDVRVLALLAPYLTPPRAVALVARTAPLWSMAVPYFGGRGGESSVHDPVARAESFAYGMFPPRAVRALCSTAAAGRRA